MNKDVFTRPLLPNDIEVRVDTCSEKTFTVVCYVNPRTAMYMLDEAFGPKNWSKKVIVDKRSQDTPIFAVCSIEVNTPDGVIIREDVGQSDTSPKNAVSDSIKRAAMNFFPSLRALYTIPQMRIYPSKLGLGNIEGKKAINDAVRYKNFYVESIGFSEGETGLFVSSIQIGYNPEKKGEEPMVVHEWTSTRTALSREDSTALLDLKKKLIEAGVEEEVLIARYKKAFRVSSLEEIASSENLLESATKFLERTKEKKSEKKPTKAKSVNDQLKGKSNEQEE